MYREDYLLPGFPPFLRAMQHIYMDKELSEKIFSLLESIICSRHATGRPGMDLWTIFVLAGARLCLNADYDRLHHLSNYDTLLRQMLGVHDGIVRGRDFDRQTLIDNVSLLDDASVTMNITVRNVGTRRLDNIKISTDFPLGWRTTISPSLIRTLDPEKEVTVHIAIIPPKDGGVGAQEVKIKTEALVFE